MRCLHPLALALVCAVASAEEPIYLGVLEPFGQVRVVFQFEKGQWAPMPEWPQMEPREGTGESCNGSGATGCLFPKMGRGYPQRVTWTVAFDGRNIGTIRTAQLALYARRTQLGLQQLGPESKAPQIRQGAALFRAGYDDGLTQTPPYRPLVVVSRPNYRDPSQWKLVAPDPAALRLARDAYRTEFMGDAGPDCVCKDSSLGIAQAYRSGTGQMLVALAMGMKDGQLLCHCPKADHLDPYPACYWFKDGKPSPLRTGHVLIDAGDYDGDGVSELLFFEIGWGDASSAYVLFCPRDGSTYRRQIPNADSH